MFKVNYILLIVILLLTSIGCQDERTLLDDFEEHKSLNDYVLDLNKSLEGIKNVENEEQIVTEDFDYLKYKYPLSLDNTYEVTYLFDEKGCHEIGIDFYLLDTALTRGMMESIKARFNKNLSFPKKSLDNGLLRWENKKMVIELDVKNVKKGYTSLTIFAYE